MNNTSYIFQDQETIPVFDSYIYVIFGTVGGLITFFTILGNSLTILSYLRDKKLHSVYNTYIFNLAIADFVLGCVVLPIYIAYQIDSYSLWMNYYLCKVFLVTDFTVCVEGVFMMIIISYDRLMLLRYGMTYSQRESKPKCYILIFSSWTLSFMIYGPFIMFWDLWYNVDINIPGICDVQFAYHFTFTTMTAILEFFIPLVLLAVVNICIITELRKRTRLRITSIFRRSLRHSLSGGSKTKSSLLSNSTETNTKEKCNSVKDSSRRTESKRCQTNHRKQREKKAIKSLGILMLVFFITWAPYTIYTIIKSIRKGDIEVLSYEALTWFLWLKSAINPFLYALNSKRYRRNFKYFLCCFNAMPYFRKSVV